MINVTANLFDAEANPGNPLILGILVQSVLHRDFPGLLGTGVTVSCHLVSPSSRFLVSGILSV
jgi:hypothetical protein